MHHEIARRPSTDINELIGKAELKKLEIENTKLSYEAAEIERRLNSSWWQGQHLSQYLVAILITSALLFGWTRAYIEPMLTHGNSINILKEEKNALEHALKNARLKKKNQELGDNKLKLSKDNKKLKEEQAELTEQQMQLSAKNKRLERETNLLKESLQGFRRFTMNDAEKGKDKKFSMYNSR